MMGLRRSAVVIALLLSACQAPAPHAPPFATVPYEAFSREDAVAIALREWHGWGSPVDDDLTGRQYKPDGDAKPERQPGLWQRVGEYWWLGMDPGQFTAAWTGKHDANGQVFPADRDEEYAWSAAFIGYVMWIAGAGPRFPYAPAHATYINLAREESLGHTTRWAVWAEAPDAVAPQPGDLVCFGRHAAARLRFADLPAGPFPAHCDIVVGREPGRITVIGGNVDDAVTLAHVPVTDDGYLVPPGGPPLAQSRPWLAVLRVLYDR
jgi:hypothetical protein